jgi:hypothetical protein
MSVLTYLKDSAFSGWLLVSMLGFPTLIALHSVGMAIVVGLTLMISLRLNGFITGLQEALIPKLVTIAVWGFTLNLVTGLAIFITRGPEYIVSYIFLLKMVLVLISASILFWLRLRLKSERTTITGIAGDSLARNMSSLATVTWFGAVVAGRLIAYLSSLYR